MDLSAAADRNVRWFIVFRVVFNARFYYPVMAILFLDLGLSLEQYALLNVAWAAAIVLLEVPSGAMADLVGRRRLVVFASFLMVIEMLIFAFTPASNLSLMFWLFFLNRIVSGAAEAAASGADEALVYDSLKQSGREKEWPDVLSRLARWQSGGFFFAMILGAAMYDPNLVNRALSIFGIPSSLTAADTVRLPVYLTLMSSVVAVIAAVRLHEPDLDTTKNVSAGAAFAEVVAAGRWILATPVALFVILATICNDSVIRMFLTIGAQYYRLIQIPEAAFGIIGSTFALLGYAAPPIARKLIARDSPAFTFAVISTATLLGLIGLGLVWPYAGLLFPMLLGLAMSVMGFATSYYLNQIAEPARRATILSFRGLSINLAYGLVGLLFAALLRSLRAADASAADDTLFITALRWMPWFFASVAALVLAKPALNALRRQS
ncbi:MFS transporter [Phragmitibacter flavus]|uniref:MFS transporter n=1 Tax=Phragmitibacter flavus TaxID=2576071 RepID=A0A5R8K7R7_9BACT|nr:MFS transporter [Phragmitibacter flavus]TLD68380.1 MFS transporter [Phragmitibacter flavus]